MDDTTLFVGGPVVLIAVMTVVNIVIGRKTKGAHDALYAPLLPIIHGERTRKGIKGTYANHTVWAELGGSGGGDDLGPTYAEFRIYFAQPRKQGRGWKARFSDGEPLHLVGDETLWRQVMQQSGVANPKEVGLDFIEFNSYNGELIGVAQRLAHKGGAQEIHLRRPKDAGPPPRDIPPPDEFKARLDLLACVAQSNEGLNTAR